MSQKLKVAIFDLTDCEGCELQFIALREKLLKLEYDLEITNWRLGSDIQNQGPFDATFIEGSPISKTDIEVVKLARRLSQKIITLGSCAYLGGVQSLVPESLRKIFLESVYGKLLKSESKPPKPVSYYIDVDFNLPGCPVNQDELERVIYALLAKRKLIRKVAPVCLECRSQGVPCLFVEEGFCLGPVTQGGCGAICPANGLRCYGCCGPVQQANLGALERAVQGRLNKKELDYALRLFFRHSNEYRDYITKPKKGKNE